MTSHQQIYKAANWLGAGCLLLSVFMGSIQLLMKAAHQNETDQKKALIESQAQVRFPEIGIALPQSADQSLPASSIPLPSESLDSQQPSQPIGTDTRLGSITVPCSPAAQSPTQSEQPFDITQDMGTNPQSCLIAGTPGSGKGMVVSNAVRQLKANHPKLIVMMIDPKADPKERGYWAGCVDVFRSASLMDCPDPDDGASWLLTCMDEFQKLESPKLLVFDEMLAACTELGLADTKLKAPQRLKKFVSGIISQGDSQFSWIWAMTQSVTSSDLGFSSGVRGNLRAIGIISPKNIAAIQGLVSTRLIPPPKGGLDELAQLMEKSPVDRAFFDGKSSRWYPMPELENHSGYDRDSRSFTNRANKNLEQTFNAGTAQTPHEELYYEPVKNEPAEEGVSNRFTEFADSLTHDSQANLKSFIQWLGKRKGEEITLKQIQDNWAKNSGVSRSGEVVMPLVNIAKSNKLIMLLPNSKWKVAP